MNISEALTIIFGLFSSETLIGVLVALVGGWLLKKWPDFDNRFIPIATAVIAVLTQFVNFFMGTPPVSPLPALPDSTLGMAAPMYLQAGLFNSGIFKVVITAVLQWLLTDKFYETQKKVSVGFKEVADGVPISKSKV